MKRIFIASMVAIVLVGTVQLAVRAQTATLDFVVPDGTPITVGFNGSGDVVIFIGRSQGTVQVGSCAQSGDYPVQSAMLVDPGSGRATRQTPIVPVSQTESVSPGTRLGNLQPLGSCQQGTTVYNKYRNDIK